MMLLSKVFGWLRRRAPAPLPDALWQETIAALPFLRQLDREEKQRLRMLTEAFLAEKTFSGAGGLALTDAMCVSIAAQGCLPILNLGLDYYRGWVGIIVYPDEFVIPRVVEDESGVVHEYDEVASGEAWADGPLLVSWRDVQMAGDGYNVIIHEFVHKLDMLDGVIDGVPPLPSSASKPPRPIEQTGRTKYLAPRMASNPDRRLRGFLCLGRRNRGTRRRNAVRSIRRRTSGGILRRHERSLL